MKLVEGKYLRSDSYIFTIRSSKKIKFNAETEWKEIISIIFLVRANIFAKNFLRDSSEKRKRTHANTFAKLKIKKVEEKKSNKVKSKAKMSENFNESTKMKEKKKVRVRFIWNLFKPVRFAIIETSKDSKLKCGNLLFSYYYIQIEFNEFKEWKIERKKVDLWTRIM